MTRYLTYLDTSSLVKLYVEETGTDEVRQIVSQAYAVATSWLAHVELRSAFARKLREGLVDAEEYRRTLVEFGGDWPRYLALEVSPEIILKAGELAEKQSLRALDAIHLASALYVAWEETLIFSSADERLLEAARSEGLSSKLG